MVLQKLFLIAVMLMVTHCNLIAQQDYILTVNGKVSASELKRALPHEHVVTNFIGADAILIPSGTDRDRLRHFVSVFKDLRAKGVNFVFECTPAYIGRDVKLLQQISKQSGVHIVTNTGIYAAVKKKYVPEFVSKETVDEIARRWEKEFSQGIEGTGIRPGFIKLGVDTGPLDSIESKLLLAAIKVSQRTGLTIAVHTGDYAAALSEYKIAIANRHDPSRLVWVHAQNASDEERLDLASKGVYISLDGVSAKNVEEYAGRILFMKKNNVLNKIILSHDDGWAVLSNGSYDKLELFGNGNDVPYTTIFSKLIPLLKTGGMSEREIELIMKENVVRCFSLR